MMLSVKRRRGLIWIGAVTGILMLGTLAGYGNFQEAPLQEPNHGVGKDDPIQFKSRSLQSAVEEFNCTPPAIEQFPKGPFTPEQRQQGAVIVHILLAAYMFLALAIACDEYFVPACEKICDSLSMQSDVAGATFMAAGSSAPELATAVIGVFIAKDDIGLGAVVGSAVFNIMFVISVCALFAGSVVYLKWFPLVRDCIFYTISILALVGVIFDGLVEWWEALILLLLYIVYIILMIFNPQLEAYIVPKMTCCKSEVEDQSELLGIKGESGKRPSSYSEEEGTEEDENPAADFAEHQFDSLEHHTLLPSVSSDANHNSSILRQEYKREYMVKPADDDEDAESPLTFPDTCGKRLLWIISLPLTLLMFITVPDCKQERWKNWWCITFTMSIIWIGAFSYIMVWMITVIGATFGIPDTVLALTLLAAGSSMPDAIASMLVIRHGHTMTIPDTVMALTFLAAGTSIPDAIASIIVIQDGATFDIPDTVMGLTFIAAGASVPDCIASILVIRDGYGDMAVSNAVGSNVFDILLCLGLPYFIKSLCVNYGEPIIVYSSGLTYSSITLLSTVVFLLFAVHINGWKLDIKLGIVLMAVYILFNVLAVLYELNLFGIVHPPTCASDY